MNIILLLTIPLIISFSFFIFFLLLVRKYRILAQTLFPIRKSLADKDYADVLFEIEKSATNLSNYLNRKGLKRGLFFEKWYPKIESKRPYYYYAIGKHLANGFANLSEVARSRFRAEKNYILEIEKIYQKIEKAICTKNQEALIFYLALYYKILRKPNFKITDFDNSQKKFNQNLLIDLEKIKSRIAKFDVAAAYSIVNKWIEKETVFLELNDYEIVFLEDLRGRLESFVQGSEYYLTKEDLGMHFKDFLTFIENLISSFKTETPAKLLKFEASR